MNWCVNIGAFIGTSTEVLDTPFLGGRCFVGECLRLPQSIFRRVRIIEKSDH